MNGMVLCAIDTETSGLTAGYHDLLEVAFVPLNAKLEPMKDVLPFTCLLQPKNRYNDSCTEAAMKVNGIKAEELLHAVGPWRAADLFEKWVEGLCLAPGKKIAPLAHNWPFDREFIRDWLEKTTFDSLIWHRCRDTMPVIQYMNDRAEFEGRRPPFPQTGLQEVRAAMGIEQQVSHRALQDAMTTAKVYRRLMDVEFGLMQTA